jgi:cytochrome c-type biogenesis protein CcmH
MVFWTIAIALTVLACAALYYAAAGRVVNATTGAGELVSTHHRLQLSEIETDIAAGRLGEAESVAAKAELAREVIRLRGEAAVRPAGGLGQGLVVLSVAAIALIALATYATMGRPDLPSAPLVARAELPNGMTLDAAVAQVEERLAVAPDDVRGWTVLAPVYMETGRYADAEHAFRNILRLEGPTADVETNLAEALLLQNGGVMAGEPQALLEDAASRDTKHIRSRFYLAGEATRAGDYSLAKAKWEELIALGQDGDDWLDTARNGLAVAEAGLAGDTPVVDAAQIRGMVEGLDTRLNSEGGTIEEWTQLVQSRLVLGERDEAQLAYDAAIAAYPDPGQRTELDALARAAQLTGVGG